MAGNNETESNKCGECWHYYRDHQDDDGLGMCLGCGDMLKADEIACRDFKPRNEQEKTWQA